MHDSLAPNKCCSPNVEFWLALAGSETYDAAKTVLNMARQKFPKEPAIWIAAAKLEESNGKTPMVGKIIERSIMTLRKEGVEIDREAWIKEAEVAERSGYMVTCNAIVSKTIEIGVLGEDRKAIFISIAEECMKRGSIETARAIYRHAVSVFSTKKSIWIKAAQLEKDFGTRESLNALLSKAVPYVPHAEVLWLMAAKEKWLAGDVRVAREILQEAYRAIPDSKEILLTASKLEFGNNRPDMARMLLAKAREIYGESEIEHAEFDLENLMII